MADPDVGFPLLRFGTGGPTFPPLPPSFPASALFPCCVGAALRATLPLFGGTGGPIFTLVLFPAPPGLPSSVIALLLVSDDIDLLTAVFACCGELGFTLSRFGGTGGLAFALCPAVLVLSVGGSVEYSFASDSGIMVVTSACTCSASGSASVSASDALLDSSISLDSVGCSGISVVEGSSRGEGESS